MVVKMSYRANLGVTGELDDNEQELDRVLWKISALRSLGVVCASRYQSRGFLRRRTPKLDHVPDVQWAIDPDAEEHIL